MGVKPNVEDQAQSKDLRQQAETEWHRKARSWIPGEQSELSVAEFQRLVHELEVHQIELELQNDQLRQAKEELEVVRDRYIDLYDVAPVGYFTLDQDSLILAVNLTGGRQLGVERSRLIGQHLSAFVFEDDVTEFWLSHRRVFNTNLQQVSELKLRKQDGVYFYAQLESIAIPDNEGNFNQCRTILSDITERKEADEALQQCNQELLLLNHAAQLFNTTLNLDQVVTAVVTGVRYLLNTTGVRVWLISPEADQLVCREAAGPQAELLRGQRLALGEGLAGWVAQHGESLLVPDAWADPRHLKVDIPAETEFRSVLCIPQRASQQVIGVLELFDPEINRFSPTELSLIEALTATAAIAIENAQLYDQVERAAQNRLELLHEVNHRVKNNLTAIVSFLYIEQSHAEAQEQPVYRAIIEKLIPRVKGIATAHDLLSATQWAPVSLSKLATRVIVSLLQTYPPELQPSVEIAPSPVRVPANQAHHLALIINELATNTLKYAASLPRRGVAITGPPAGDRSDHLAAGIAVRIVQEAKTVRFEFRDNGPGYPEEVLRLERHQVGLELIRTMVRGTLHGELTLGNDGGAVTTIRFPLTVDDDHDASSVSLRLQELYELKDYFAPRHTP